MWPGSPAGLPTRPQELVLLPWMMAQGQRPASLAGVGAALTQEPPSPQQPPMWLPGSPQRHTQSQGCQDAPGPDAVISQVVSTT